MELNNLLTAKNRDELREWLTDNHDMVKFIMAQYGYTSIDGGLSERARIPAISGTEYFSTSGIYKKTDAEKYVIRITAESVE